MRSTISFAKIARFLRRRIPRARGRAATRACTPKPSAIPKRSGRALPRELEWSRPWDRVLDWKPPHAKWFVGGKLNASVNCLDRHVRGRAPQQGGAHLGRRAGRSPHAHLLRPAPRGRRRSPTSSSRSASSKGDRVAIYLPLIPELAIAMLACARIGAVHTVVFGGFSAESLRDRINDAQCSAARSPPTAAIAAGRSSRSSRSPTRRSPARRRSRHVVVVQRRGGAAMPVAHEGRPRPLVARADAATPPSTCEPEPMDAEDMLYILYTSGTTGKPKGIVHTTGGYLVGTYATTKLVFDLQGRRRLLVHGRHRLGDRPQLRRLRPARQRRDGADVRGRARLAGEGSLLGADRAATASRSSTPRRRRFARS